MSGRNGKNIDSTNNMKRGQKTIMLEKVSKGVTFFFQIYQIRRVKTFSFCFVLSRVKNFDLALRGGSKLLSRHFEFDQPPTTKLQMTNLMIGDYRRSKTC